MLLQRCRPPTYLPLRSGKEERSNVFNVIPLLLRPQLDHREVARFHKEPHLFLQSHFLRLAALSHSRLSDWFTLVLTTFNTSLTIFISGLHHVFSPLRICLQNSAISSRLLGSMCGLPSAYKNQPAGFVETRPSASSGTGGVSLSRPHAQMLIELV